MRGGGEIFASIFGFGLLAWAAIGQRLRALIDRAFGDAIDHDFPASHAATHVRQREDVQ